MKLKITGGTLTVEVEGDILEEARKQLEKASDDNKEEKKETPVSKPTQDGLGALNRKPKMEI